MLGYRRKALPLVVLALVLLASTTGGSTSSETGPVTGASAESHETGPTFTVFAHRLGLVGGVTANGHVIQENDRFATLPCFCALSSQGGNEFQVRITYGDRSVVVPIWDVGPWNVNDNYWDPQDQREWSDLPRGLPQAQAAIQDGHNGGLDGWDREVRSPAGMDIADGTFLHDLGMTEDDWVEVTFLWLDEGESTEPESPPVEVAPPAEPEPDPVQFEQPAGIPVVYPGERPPLDPADPKGEPEYYYVSQTGHNMAADIWYYWNRHGGWRFFGLPISELYVEIHEDGTEQLVQLFERSILEYNPGSDDRPLVQGRRVGQYAEAPDWAREPVAPFDDTRHSLYFQETGHSLSHGFKHEWESRGGLEVFGYPITEEFAGVTPDGREYVAQVFERARFEWWPDRVGTGEEITYGLLVVERQKELGFLP